MGKTFPMQGPGPAAIPWSLAEEIYQRYACAYGSGQSLERLAERGGFGWGEVECIYKDHARNCNGRCLAAEVRS